MGLGVNTTTRMDTAKQRDIRSVAEALGIHVTRDGKHAYCKHSRGPGKGTPSITFYRGRQDGGGRFKCHSCGDTDDGRGDVVDLVQFWLGCDTADALTYLAGDLPMPERKYQPLEELASVPYADRVKACEAFHGACADLDVVASRFLDDRGIDPIRAAQEFGVRVVTTDRGVPGQSGSRAMAAAIQATSADVVVELGLAKVSESRGTLYERLFGHWLVIPYLGPDGEIGHLQFRRLHRNSDNEGKGSKYLHASGEVPYPWGVDAFAAERDDVGMVEGALDAMACRMRGYAVVGLPGTSWMTPERAARVAKRADGKTIWVGLDADAPREDGKAPGPDAQRRVLSMLADAGHQSLQAVVWPADFIADPDKDDWCDWWRTNTDHPGVVAYEQPVERPEGMDDAGAERALLRALLSHTVDPDDVAIDGRAFTVEANGRAWDTILATWRRDGHMDPTLLASALPEGLLESLPAKAPNGDGYLRRVGDLYQRRTFLEAAERAVRAVKAGRSVEQARMMLTADEMPADGRDRQTMAESLRRWESARYSTERRVISTTIPELDDMLGGGFHMGLVNGVLAEKGTGKTTYLLVQVALAAAQADVPVLRISMELPEEHLVAKDLSHLSHVPYGSLKPQADGALRPEHAAEVAYHASLMQSLPMWNVYGKLTVEQIHEEVRRHHRRYGVRLVVIDTFHSAKTGAKGPRSPLDKYQRAGEIAHEMAQEFPSTAIVWLGQTGAGIAHRSSHLPMLTDWKYQGEFVDQCRAMVGIYDPRKYEPDHAMVGMMRFIPLKASLGHGAQTDGVWMRADLDYQAFRPVGGGGWSDG